MRRGIAVIAAMFIAVAAFPTPAAAHDDGSEFPTQREPVVERALAAQLPEPVPLGPARCAGGNAAGYACSNVDLLSFLPVDAIGGGNANDIWGWTDPVTGAEYALVGRSTGTSFVDISNPARPVYLGDLPSATSSSPWRDLKTYGDFVFIVSEADRHGMQVFDLTQLRDVAAPPVAFTPTTTYTAFGSAHNVIIDEDSGYAYAVGTDTCSGGLHIIDITLPTSPVFVNCFADDGYTHDAQCVVYHGPDRAYLGREICIAANEDTVTIVDVTDKAEPRQISRTTYRSSAYTHQAWLTEDHAFLLLDDELDERRRDLNTTTYIWELDDLRRPELVGTHAATTRATDHNLYVKGQHAYLANYRAGLRILDLDAVAEANVSEVGYFDIYPGSDAAAFNGAWSNYPFFTSGVVIVSGIEQGLYVLRPDLDLGRTTQPQPR